jgi:hypothetical protein
MTEIHSIKTTVAESLICNDACFSSLSNWPFVINYNKVFVKF